MPETATFIDHLRRSGLVEPKMLDEALEQIEAEYARRSNTDIGGDTDTDNDNDVVATDRLAFFTQSLVHRYLLTAWQIRQLLKGRYKGFFLRQYKILGHLGSGGMSSVYLAEHTVMQRRVAIKVLPKKRLEKAIYLQRFIREAQAIATLDHPNIVRAYDIDREGDVHYIVMEYFDGLNLQQIVESEGPLPFERIVSILRQAAGALSHAHAIGVVHRDIKPGNLLVDKNDNVKLLDLGLALLDERLFEGRISSIQEDTILGTADYLAPEQAIDSHKVDARADIYGLGGVLYFCLTGHPPFPEGSVSKRLLAHQQKTPPSILLDRPDTPGDLVDLCTKMMSKQPGRRHGSAEEVAWEMDDWLLRHGYTLPEDAPRPGSSRQQDSPPTAGLSASVETTDDSEADRSSVPFPETAAGDDRDLLAGRSKLLSLIRKMDEEKKEEAISEPGHDSDFSVLGGEVSINLLDTAAGSVAAGKGGESSVERRIFNEIRRNARKESDREEDPILLALNEIERNRIRARKAAKARKMSIPRRSQGLPVLPEDTAGTSETSPNSPQGLQPSDEKHGETSVKTGPDNPVPHWYRLVPIWFWSLFAAAVFTSVFLAGVLAALITFILNRTS